jgi:hypothetical protein
MTDLKVWFAELYMQCVVMTKLFFLFLQAHHHNSKPMCPTPSEITGSHVIAIRQSRDQKYHIGLMWLTINWIYHFRRKINCSPIQLYTIGIID